MSAFASSSLDDRLARLELAVSEIAESVRALAVLVDQVDQRVGELLGKELLGVRAAAEVLELSPSTLNRWRSEGRHNAPKVTRVGGRVFYSREELVRWLRSNTAGSAT